MNAHVFHGTCNWWFMMMYVYPNTQASNLDADSVFGLDPARRSWLHGTVYPRTLENFHHRTSETESGEAADLEVSWNRGIPLNHPFNGMFPYKPSVLGYPHLWKPPFRGTQLSDSGVEISATLQVVKEEETQKILDAYVTATFPGFFRPFSRGCATENSMPQPHEKVFSPRLGEVYGLRNLRTCICMTWDGWIMLNQMNMLQGNRTVQWKGVVGFSLLALRQSYDV